MKGIYQRGTEVVYQLASVKGNLSTANMSEMLKDHMYKYKLKQEFTEKHNLTHHVKEQHGNLWSCHL